MQRIKIRVPATITNLGPAISGLALAVQLNCSVEFRERDDNELVVKSADDYDPLEHPIVPAAIRVFQHMERAPSGFEIRVENGIPIGVGLGDKTAFSVAGVIGANNLINANLPREVLMTLAAQAAQSGEGVAAAMLGGLATGILDNDKLFFRALAQAAVRVIIVVPELSKYKRKAHRAVPKTVDYADAVQNIRQIPILVDAFQQLDFDGLHFLSGDRILATELANNMDGYDDVIAAAQQAGAAAVTISGLGPAVVAYASDKHHDIADAMRRAFQRAGVTTQTWVLPVDRQGVVVSMTQSA